VNTRVHLPLAIAVALSICPTAVRAQTDWNPYDGNPVLAPGSGTWDSGGVFSHTIIESGDSLKMWYTGASDLFSPSTWAIGYATSTDGTTWSKHSANPVMTGRPGEWDQPGVHTPSVILDGDTLRMWYVGGNGIDHAPIGYATSLDGVNWDRHPEPVMETGQPGTWNEDSMGPGSVIKEDGVFKA